MNHTTTFLRTLCLSALLGLIASAAATAADKRPNIIILYIDDLARGDVGAFGCPDPGTENIDRLADLGFRFDNAYTHNAPCSPSRTSLMMGCYTQRFGKYDLSRGVPIPEDKPALAETLRDAGYLTAMIGHEKWDIGKWDQGALDRGFMLTAKQPPRLAARDAADSGSWYVDINGSYLTETEGDYAVEFLSRHGKSDKPFFLYYVPLAVHTPLHEVPKKYLDHLYPGHEGEYAPRQYLRASLHALDVQIGRILDKLEEMDIAKETLIIFSSDNGGDPGAQARPLPFRGGKGGPNRSNLQWEGNYRMPTIVAFPGTLPAGKTFSGMSSTIDFYATAAALAQTPLPKHCEGVDLMPLLLGKQQPDPERILFWNTHGSQITRWKNWRIVKFRDEPSWRLFDIVADPGETTNLADKHPEILQTMAARYDAWLGQMQKPARPVPPPAELLDHTAKGRHARRPFGYGWMTVEEWDKIKHDPVHWSEFHARERILKEKNK
jgi:arylsulfatase A-like enzyme